MPTKTFPAHFKADTSDGTFEAVVAVFGNVDLQGDRIVPGAFANTLEEWRTSGDPIPVVFSHQWHDLDAHLGGVEPGDAVELEPGDPRLPDSLSELGGLWVKGALDMDDPAAAKVHRKMSRRLIKEFSFAYDIRAGGSKRASDGVTELTDLELFEVGPTLKGANPATVLIGAKDLEAVPGLTAAQLDAITKAVNAALAGTKAQVTADGSIESHLGAIAGAVREWATELYGRDLYWAFVEATFVDHVLAYIELWDEPYNGGTFYEVPYTAADDTVTLGEPVAVTLRLETVPKAHLYAPRAKEGRRNSTADTERVASIHALTVQLGADCATTATDPPATTARSLDDFRLLASVRRELIELDLVDD